MPTHIISNMAPNNKGLIKAKENCTQAALPYDQPAYVKAKEEVNTGNSGGPAAAHSNEVLLHSDDEEDGGLQVNTVARYSYELDRFNKNTMLILSHESHRNTKSMIAKLRDTFEKFRFEVDVYQIQNCDEIFTTCENFFSQDFTNYGSVAVVLLAEMNRDCLLEVNGATYEEESVRRHLTSKMPPTLNEKPKIYIFESCGYYKRTRAKLCHPDILEFILPMSFYVFSAFDVQHQPHKYPRPLEILCNNVSRLGDQQDLSTILHATDREILNIIWPTSYDYRCVFSSTLGKEIRLARSVESQYFGS